MNLRSDISVFALFTVSSVLLLQLALIPTVAKSAASLQCFETDGGSTFQRAGYAGMKNANGEILERKPDTCHDSALTEYSCTSGGSLAETNYECEYGCRNGACLDESFALPQNAASRARRKERAERMSVSIAEKRIPSASAALEKKKRYQERHTGIRRNLRFVLP